MPYRAILEGEIHGSTTSIYTVLHRFQVQDSPVSMMLMQRRVKCHGDHGVPAIRAGFSCRDRKKTQRERERECNESLKISEDDNV